MSSRFVATLRYASRFRRTGRCGSCPTGLHVPCLTMCVPYTPAREDGLLTPEGVPKKCGGIFLNLLKQLKQGTAMQEAAAVLPDLPDLRSYQQDVVGMVLHSWGLPQVAGAPKGGGGVGGRGNGNGALGGAGAGAGAAAQRYEDMANGWRGNWLISAPTGSGKTRMFIEVAR